MDYEELKHVSLTMLGPDWGHVARIERSEIREHPIRRRTAPDFAALHPGYG